MTTLLLIFTLHGAFYYSDQFIRRLADEMLFLALRERIHVRVRP